MSKGLQSGNGFGLSAASIQANRGLFVGGILFIALIAFEIFNFDTTQFALQSLLGNVTFIGLQWATILAIAFCAIDFAGLNRLFTPEGNPREQKEVWFLMGAWLLGATMNAVMTWWAVSVTLLNNNYGNEVLSREQILRFVPIFVAVLVWLTRILFIGSLSIAGVTLFGNKSKVSRKNQSKARPQQSQYSGKSRNTAPSRINAAPKPNNKVQNESVLSQSPINQPSPISPSRSSRVRQRPPMPNARIQRPTNNGIQARNR